MANKWQKLAISNRERISYPRITTVVVDEESCSTSSVAQKGHFVVYTADQKRFKIPLTYLTNNIIRELFIMAEDGFGLPSTGPITLPCDSFHELCSLFDPKKCSKRCREGTAPVFIY